NSDGGDEVLAGYDRYRAALAADRLERTLPVPKRAYSLVAAALPAGRDLRAQSTRARRFMAGLAEGRGARYTRWMSIFEPGLLAECATSDFAALSASCGAGQYLAAPLDHRNGTKLHYV